MIYVEQQPCDPGYAASDNMISHLIKTLMPHHRMAFEIQGKKSWNQAKKYRLLLPNPSFHQGSSSSRESQSFKWHHPRMASLYIEEAEVVGFEAPRDELIGWLVEGPTKHTVGGRNGGQGKTTIARKDFDNQKMVGHFDCQAWITTNY
ncbi:Disease resistance protein RPM1 [Spatholobus suberectus]|nr:Disease resistance protein RPM1 [Spatholobus suberectus]